MAGGTGGHIFPALAIAKALSTKGHEVLWLGSKQGMENSLVPDAGFTIYTMSITGLRGKGLLRWFFAPIRLLRAIVDALQLFRRHRPDVVVGMGGFVSGPGGVASFLLGVPLVIHEQNSVAGLTNRLLQHLAVKVCCAFPQVFNKRGEKYTVTGNPVREDILQLPPLVQRYAQRQNTDLHLLILGGSLGAKTLNEKVPKAITRLLAEGKTYQVWHQCGKKHWQSDKPLYPEKEEIRVEPFITDMAAAYAWADVIICRAGALTISEIAAAGCASLFVPYPYAVDNHQYYNALYMQQAGAAEIVQDSELNVTWIYNYLMRCQRQQLLQQAIIAQSLAKPDATQLIVEYILTAKR